MNDLSGYQVIYSSTQVTVKMKKVMRKKFVTAIKKKNLQT